LNRFVLSFSIMRREVTTELATNRTPWTGRVEKTEGDPCLLQLAADLDPLRVDVDRP
jgi:hypothetical protein